MAMTPEEKIEFDKAKADAAEATTKLAKAAADAEAAKTKLEAAEKTAADLAKAQQEVTDLKAKLEKGGAGPDEKLGLLEKSVTTLSAKLEKAEADLAADRAKAAEFQKAAERLSAEAEAREKLPFVKGTVAEKAQLLMSARSLPKDQADAIIASLVASNAAGADLAKARGHAGEPSTEAGGGGGGTDTKAMMQKAEARIDEIAKGRGIDRASAFILAVKEDADLSAAYSAGELIYRPART